MHVKRQVLVYYIEFIINYLTEYFGYEIIEVGLFL